VARPTSPKKANRLPIFLALLFGLVAAVLIIAYLRSQGSSDVAAAAPTLSVLVATQDIAAGQKITKSMVKLKPVPKDDVIQDALTSKDEDEVLGQKLRYPVAKGEQLSKLRLVGGVKGQGLSFQVPDGMRAFTIPVNTTNTPAALIAPGDFVDVLVSGPAGALRLAPQLAATRTQNFDPDKRATLTLLQNVQVLAVQREYVENAGDPASRGALPEKGTVTHVTLALVPGDVQLLWQASTEGKITLALRSFGDAEIVPIDPITELRAQGLSPQLPQGLRPVDDAKTKSLDPITVPRAQGLSFQIPQGLRAFTIPVKVTDTPAALIAPGDFVDVLASGPIKAFRLAPQLAAAGTANSNQNNQATVTLLQNVLVLAVQRDFGENTPYDPAAAVRGVLQKEAVSHVTLALTPEQVQLLWQASTEKGKITLALRSFGDGETKPLAAITDPRSQGLSYQVPNGLRGFTIPVDVTNTPAALIAPGDFVDVLVSGSMQTLRLARHLAAAWGENANEERKVTATMLQNVRVLAVQREFLETAAPDAPAAPGQGSVTNQQSVLPQKETVSYVTLALTPEQGQLLQVVSKEGTITLALRRLGDAELVAVDPITEPRAKLLSYQIPQGWRAFTFPVSVRTSPVALLAPGDFVDVLGTVDLIQLVPTIGPQGLVVFVEKKVGTKVETLLQNMRVLSVQREYLNKDVPQDASVRGAPPNGEAGWTKDDVPYLTLALTPRDVQLLAVYSALRVTLRQVGDEQLPVLDPLILPILQGP
jgi:pilus assembly protein CpaB